MAVEPLPSHIMTISPGLPTSSFSIAGRAHLVGIAGAGMSSLADVLFQAGWKISGSDLAVSATAANGSRFQHGHSAAHVARDIDLLIYSSAIPPDNPELLRASELGIPTLTYAQMLGRLMSDRQGLAVAGTHGKSTTAAMTAHILVAAGLDPTVVVGASPLGASSGGRFGRGQIMLVEACEYRGNFLQLRPKHAAILGIEPDHFDCYDSHEQLELAFRQFADLTPNDGLLLVPHDCRATRRATAAARCRKETFGVNAAADWSARNLTAHGGRYGFEIHHRGQSLGQVDLRVPGMHNVQNALAAAALARAGEASADDIVHGLNAFRGLHRRLEVLGAWAGVTLVDDYAHHPTEVTVSLDALRRMFPGRRLWCVFQPHQASRTARLLDELAASLQNADRVLVADIFRAREGTPRQGEVTAADLARQVRAGGAQCFDIHTAEEITRLLETQLVAGDVLVTMGAGDIGRIANGFLERVRENRAAG